MVDMDYLCKYMRQFSVRSDNSKKNPISHFQQMELVSFISWNVSLEMSLYVWNRQFNNNNNNNDKLINTPLKKSLFFTTENISETSAAHESFRSFSWFFFPKKRLFLEF